MFAKCHNLLCIDHRKHKYKLKLQFWENHLKVLPIQIIQQIQSTFQQIVEITLWGENQIFLSAISNWNRAFSTMKLHYDQASSAERCFALDAVLMLTVLIHLKNQGTVNFNQVVYYAHSTRVILRMNAIS